MSECQLCFITAVKPCVTKTDTIFVVDKSSGLSKDEFEKIRSFISRAAKRLGIGMKNKRSISLVRQP